MSLVAPQEGEVLIISLAINKTAQGNLKLHLYENDHTPTDESVFSDLVEPTDSGYGIKNLIGATWTVASSPATTASYPTQTFTFLGAATVYGYFVSDGFGTVAWLERFPDAPINIPSGGGNIDVTLNISVS